MDPRLLRHYNTELAHLREMGAEFAEHFPKIASRLGMNGTDVADPYVERLLEGTAFLAARVQLKIEAGSPASPEHLALVVWRPPACPTPPMRTPRSPPAPPNPNLAKGFAAPRHPPLSASHPPESRRRESTRRNSSHVS